MTALIDDPSVLVRRALAEALCRAHDAPRTVILACWRRTSRKRPPPVLQYSPVLTDADLVDCVANGDAARSDGAGPPAEVGAVKRPPRSPKTGQLDAVLALIGNLDDRSSSRIAARHSDPLRRRCARARCAARARFAAGSLTGAHRGGGGEGSGRRGVAMDGARAGRARRPRGARSGDLHDRLVMPSRRAGGAYACAARRRRTDAGLAAAFAAWRRTDLFAQALAELSGLPTPRVAAFMLEPQGRRLRRARPPGWPEGAASCLAFRAALAAIKTHAGESGDGLKLPLVQKVIDECEQLDDPALAKVLALLWRFAAEAAKAEAASFAREAAASASSGRLPLAPGIFARQRRRRSRAEADRGLLVGLRQARRRSSSTRRRRIRATIKPRASNCRPSLSPGSTTRPEGQALGAVALAPSAISWRACAIACRSTEGSCAPGTPTRPPKMKNGTPLTPIA